MKRTKRTFNLILTLALWLVAAQTVGAIELTKTFSLSTATVTNDYLSIKATDPDDNTQKAILTVNGTMMDVFINSYNTAIEIMNVTDAGSGSGNEVQLFISPYVDGKVTRVEFTKAGRRGTAFAMSIDGMKYNGTDDALTGVEASGESTSFTFISTDAAGIAGNLTMRLGVGSDFFIDKSAGCQLVITYIPSVEPTHSHDFTFNAVGNTLTATCGHSDGLDCSLADANYHATLTLSPPIESFYRPGTYYSASHNLSAFNTQTGLNGTTEGIRYSTDGTNYTNSVPNAIGDYTARLIVTIGSTNYTLTQSFRIVAYSDINNIYPQFNVSTDDYASTTMAGEGQTVTITFTPKFGETLTSLTVTGATTNYSIGSGITDNGSNTYTFTMPAENVTIGATFSISENDFAETGTNEYTIKTANGWGWFCFAVNYDLAPDGFSGKTVKLDADVSSSEMAGTSSHPFKGTFDGQSNTLTVAYGTIDTPFSEQYAAPFRYLNGGAINNLHVTGTITTSAKYAAGIAGNQLGTVIIRNCRSSVTIDSSVSGDGTHGGFVGTHSNTLTIEGCVFNGSLLGASTNCCGGFVGWRNGTLNITNSLFAPAEVTFDVATGNYPCCTFSRNGVSTITNSYYTTVLGKRQGRPATKAPDEPTNLGKATTDHGLVDGYENGLFYNGNYYTPKYGDVVVEYMVSNNSEHADVTINGEGNNLVGVNITEEVDNVTSVTYNRTFTSGVAATVILPFNYTCNGYEGGKFYGFKEVTYDDDDHIWVCTMKEPGEEGSNNVTSLTANTPYLFMPSDAKMKFPYIEHMTGGVVTLQPTTANEGLYGGATTDYDWNFYGTYVKKTWASSDSDKDYGFAAIKGTAVHGEEVVPGQFVRLATGAWMNPMRCYLSYVGTSAPAPARGLTRAAATDDLPATITVRLVSRNGDVEAIGTLNMETGEMSFEGWYTLDGVRLDGKPSTKGIYINNGKKIVIK